MHQRLMKSSAKPASGPENSVPDTGSPAQSEHSWQMRPISRTMVPFTEPHRDSPRRREVRRDLFGNVAAAPTGTHTMTRSGPSTAAAFVPQPDRRGRARRTFACRGRARRRGDRAHEILRFRGSRDRRDDQPDANQRQPLKRSWSRRAPQKSLSALTTSRLALQCDRSRRALEDRNPRRAKIRPPGRKASASAAVRPFSCGSGSARVRHARRHLQSSLPISSASQGTTSHWATDFSRCALSSIAATPARIAGVFTLNDAMRLSASTMWPARRASRAARRQARGSSKRCGTSRPFSDVATTRCRLVSLRCTYSHRQRRARE